MNAPHARAAALLAGAMTVVDLDRVMDIETAVRERIPILSILLNNFSMAIEIPIMQVATEKYRSMNAVICTSRVGSRRRCRPVIRSAGRVVEDRMIPASTPRVALISIAPAAIRPGRLTDRPSTSMRGPWAKNGNASANTTNGISMIIRRSTAPGRRPAVTAAASTTAIATPNGHQVPTGTVTTASTIANVARIL